LDNLQSNQQTDSDLKLHGLVRTFQGQKIAEKMPRISVQSPGIAIDDLENVESPRRPRRSVAPLPGSLVEPGRIKSSSKGNTLEDLAEDKEGESRLEEEEVFDENEEAVKAPSQLGEDQDAYGRQVFGSFGYRTPKKGATGMREKAAEALARTPLSQKQNTPGSGGKRPKLTPNSTPTKSNQSTPVKGILKTPLGKRRMIEPETPASTRKRVKKTLIRIAEEAETRVFSGSESEEEVEDSDEEDGGGRVRHVLKGPPSTPRTPARKGRPRVEARDLDTTSMAEGYFSAHSGKTLTSDRTLSKLSTPRLSATEVNSLLGDTGIQYKEEVKELLQDHAVYFPKWLSLLHRGFNIVTYGLGSKKSLLHQFHDQHLTGKDTVVVNGFFPSLTIKSVLSHISEDVLEMETSPASATDHLAEILATMDEEKEHVYLIVHNIDGTTLRNEKSQDILAGLAGHPKIHLICSIDHINAPLIWDQRRLSKLNFIWFDCTTFLPYREETGSENSLMTRQSGGLQLASLSSVWPSLTPNAKKVFLVIVKYQMDNTDTGLADYSGLSFMELYRLCRADFLVASDLALRAQLTEFRDHQLVLSKRGSVDGGEYLTIPLDRPTLQAFLENIEES